MPTENKSSKPMAGRQRVSAAMSRIEGQKRSEAKEAVLSLLADGQLSQGQALKTLRVEVLGLKQEQFARMVKVSRKTLSDVENDKGNYSVNTLNQIFRPFALKVGLVDMAK